MECGPCLGSGWKEVKMVYQKLTRLLAPRIGLYFGVMLAFAGVTALLGETQAAVAELIVVGVLLIACGASALRRKQEADRYLKELMDSMDQATRDSTLNCPLPLVMFRPDTDEVVWSNDHFLRLTGDQERMFDTKMSDLAPNFDSRWLLEGKSECPEEVELGHRRYQVFGDMARPAAGKEEGLLATTYWLDVTDLADTRDIFKATRPVLALLLLSSHGDPARMLSFPFQGGRAINLYTILFIVFFGIGYGAYYATADMPIPMVADCSDYETYRSGKYIPGIMGTLFSLVDKLVSSLAQTLVAFIFLACAGLSDLPTDSTPYSGGIKAAVIVMFCIIPMLAWAATLLAMKGYTLTGEKMKTIQAVNAARKEAVAQGMGLEQAMESITDETVGKK